MAAYSALSDQELVNAILQGDQQASSWLFTSLLPGYIRRMMKENFSDLPVGPEDLAHDLYAHLSSNNWRNLRQYNGGSGLLTWLHVIAYRTADRKYNLRRLKGFKGFVPLNELALAVDPAPGPDITVQKRADLLEYIHRLSNPRERLMLLYFLDGYSTEEIAGLMDTSRNAIHILKNRAINKLKELMVKQTSI